MTPPIQPGTARRLSLRRASAVRVVEFIEHHLDRTVHPWQREVIRLTYRGRG